LIMCVGETMYLLDHVCRWNNVLTWSCV